MKLNTNENFIKCRDDQEIFRIKSKDEKTFVFIDDMENSWKKKGDEILLSELRQRIEPWLTSLFQSEHLSLLVGSGLTIAIGGIAKSEKIAGMGSANFGDFNEHITLAAEKTAELINKKESNLEDQIRVANELIKGIDHYCLVPGDGVDALFKKNNVLRTTLNQVLLNFASSIIESERNILSAPDRDLGFEYLVNFLLSPASRNGTRDRLHIFTTNYDRIIEAGSEIAGIHLLDRFIGNISPIFRSSRLSIDLHYNPPGIRGEPRFLEGVTRYTKLHGSIDWVSIGRDIRRIGLPFGAKDIKPFLDASGMSGVDPLNLMIYPNSSKDRETAEYPYVDLFRDFAAAICQPNHTLVTYGYGFNDEHINRVIEDMLTIPSTHLVIISYGDASERIWDTYRRIGRPAQTTVLVGNHLGDLKTLVDHYLPKPAIDKTTYRMTELIKSRLSSFEPKSNKEDESG